MAKIIVTVIKTGEDYISLPETYESEVDYIFRQSTIHDKRLKLTTEDNKIIVIPLDVLNQCIITFEPIRKSIWQMY